MVGVGKENMDSGLFGGTKVVPEIGGERVESAACVCVLKGCGVCGSGTPDSSMGSALAGGSSSPSSSTA